MDVVSIGPMEAEPGRLRDAFAAVAERLHGRKLGFVYLPHTVDAVPLLRAAREGLGDRIVGATTGGGAFTERGFTRDGVVGGVFGGSGFDYAVSVTRGLSESSVAHLDAERLRASCGEIVVAARKHVAVARTPSLMTLAVGHAVDGVSVTDTLSSCTPPHWRIFGGTAGDSLDFVGGARVFVDDEVIDNAAVLVGLFTTTHCGIAVGHGWSAVPGAAELVVTAIEGSRLISLDGRPAGEVYGEELHRLGLISDPAKPLPEASRHALGARTRFDELTIRAVLEFPNDGTLLLAGAVIPGTVLQVVATTPEALAASARSVGRRCLEDLSEDQTPRGGLVFDCAARFAYLADAYPAETQGFFGGHAFPIIGTTSYGEIAKSGGSLEGFHNATAVMAAW